MITPYSNIISVTTLEALLLDTYSGAAAAYSLRKLSTTYTGSAIRVRRASDNTEQDIGFVDNELDTSALTTFCSGTDGFVETWYDQSGNARDATQSTAADQPQIVSSGSVILENGKPSLEFNGTSNKLSTTSTPFSQTESTLITVAKQNGITSGYKRLLCIGNYNDGRYLGSNTGTDDMLAIFNDSTLSESGGVSILQNLSIAYNIGTSGFLRQNGAAISTKVANNASFGNEDLFIGSDKAFLSTEVWNGKIQECIYYGTEQSANVTGIETNINDFYSIY
jgi:hypothetical protein